MEYTLERRERIAEALRFRRRDTAGRLAAEFGVSRHTIMRDLIVLSLSYPIHTVAGGGGGVIWTGKKAEAPAISGRALEALHNAANVVSAEDKAEIERLISVLRPVVPFQADWAFKILETTGLTQTQLADKLGITGAHLSFVLSGRRKPSAALAERISNIRKELET